MEVEGYSETLLPIYVVMSQKTTISNLEMYFSIILYIRQCFIAVCVYTNRATDVPYVFFLLLHVLA
jgi:hypothetical protein